MSVSCGYITCSFNGPSAVLEQFLRTAAEADRQNTFSCGLSWLDELDSYGEAESDAVSYDTLDATKEFLTHLSQLLPELEAEGRIEHSWPVLPIRTTVVEFSLCRGALAWKERTEDEVDPLPFLPESDDDDPEEIEIPLTPY